MIIAGPGLSAVVGDPGSWQACHHGWPEPYFGE
jgi:hypothetical protein